VRLACRLREIRGARTMSTISKATGVPIPQLSKIERGFEVPRDAWIPALADAYGAPITDWYPSQVLLALEPETQT